MVAILEDWYILKERAHCMEKKLETHDHQRLLLYRTASGATRDLPDRFSMVKTSLLAVPSIEHSQHMSTSVDQVSVVMSEYRNGVSILVKFWIWGESTVCSLNTKYLAASGETLNKTHGDNMP